MASAALRFRPLRLTDVAAMHRLHGDPSTNEHNPYGASPDVAATTATLAEWIHHAEEHGFGYEIAELEGDVVGVCGARYDEWAGRRVVNLYWRLLPEFWGRGLAASLADHALQVARSRAGSRSDPVVARMLPGNDRSRRVAERLGLERRLELDGDAAGQRWIVYAEPDVQTA